MRTGRPPKYPFKYLQKGERFFVRSQEKERVKKAAGNYKKAYGGGFRFERVDETTIACIRL